MTDVKSKRLAGGETFETADRLHSAAIHLLRRLRVRDRESGVGPAQLSALSVLVLGGGPAVARRTSRGGAGPPADDEPDRRGIGTRGTGAAAEKTERRPACASRSNCERDQDAPGRATTTGGVAGGGTLFIIEGRRGKLREWIEHLEKVIRESLTRCFLGKVLPYQNSECHLEQEVLETMRLESYRRERWWSTN